MKVFLNKYSNIEQSKESCKKESSSLASYQVLSVSPEHPAMVLSLRRVQCQRLLLAGGGAAVLPDQVLEQLSSSVMVNPTNLGAWHVSGSSLISKSNEGLCN